MISTNGEVHGRVCERLSRSEAASRDWRPILFRMGEEADRRALSGLLENPEVPVQICDTIALQLRDLMQSRHPVRKLTAAELDSLTGEHLRGVALEEYGVSAYYPWSGRLVHEDRRAGRRDVDAEKLNRPSHGEIR